MPSAEVRRFLRRQGVSLAEWYVLISVGYSICATDRLAEITAAESADRFGRITLGEAEIAVRSCLRRGWLRHVDEAALLEIRGYLEAKGITDTEGCLPRVGETDFTVAGAEFYRQLCLEWNGPDWAIDDYFLWRHGAAYRVYSRTLQGALNAIEDYRQQANVCAIGEPVPTGPWCVTWWKTYPQGYRVDLELVDADE